MAKSSGGGVGRGEKRPETDIVTGGLMRKTGGGITKSGSMVVRAGTVTVGSAIQTNVGGVQSGGKVVGFSNGKVVYRGNYTNRNERVNPDDIIKIGVWRGK